MVHFGFVNKDLVVSSFALTEIVICIRKLLLLFVKVVVYIPSVCTMVKDKMKQSYGRPFFVCAERENQCKFWQWGDVYRCPRPLYQHGMVSCERKVKKDGPSQNRLFYCCPIQDACGFFEWKQQGTRAIKTGFALFSNPLQYRYKIDSTKSNTKDAYQEFMEKKLVEQFNKQS